MLLLLLACASTPPALIAEPALLGRFRELHAPLPGAYALPADRDLVYDTLAASLDGELLTREYVEVWTALRRMEDEGSALRVDAVEYEALRRVSLAPLRVEASWRVTGTVTHRGHSHRRANRYRAVFTLAETEAGLRIVDAQAVNHERLLVQEEGADEGGLLELRR